uniref:Uncharacterized protein n=1 Tax=Lates calcarifer TaxID=8187 RepID=A0A4W6DMY8_LATCA
MERLLCPSSLQGRPSSRASSSPSSSHALSSSSSSSNSHSESSSTVSTPSPVTRVRSNCKRSNSGVGTTRNNQNHMGTEDYRNQINNNNNSSHESLVFHIPHGHKPGTFPTSLAHKHAMLSPIIDSTSVNWRTGSFHGYRGRNSCRRGGTSSLAAGDRNPSSASPSCGVGVPSPLATLDHRLSIYDNVPDDQPLSEGEGGDAERTGEESEVSRLLADEDVFSALDSVLERISDLQQLVSTWSENLSDDSQRASSSSSSSVLLVFLHPGLTRSLLLGRLPLPVLPQPHPPGGAASRGGGGGGGGGGGEGTGERRGGEVEITTTQEQQGESAPALVQRAESALHAHQSGGGEPVGLPVPPAAETRAAQTHRSDGQILPVQQAGLELDCSQTGEEDQGDGGERSAGVWSPSAPQCAADRRAASSQHPPGPGLPEDRMSGPGRSFPEVGGQVSYPVPPRAGGVQPRRHFVRQPVRLRRRRHGEAVLQRPA